MSCPNDDTRIPPEADPANGEELFESGNMYLDYGPPPFFEEVEPDPEEPPRPTRPPDLIYGPPSWFERQEPDPGKEAPLPLQPLLYGPPPYFRRDEKAPQETPPAKSPDPQSTSSVQDLISEWSRNSGDRSSVSRLYGPPAYFNRDRDEKAPREDPSVLPELYGPPPFFEPEKPASERKPEPEKPAPSARPNGEKPEKKGWLARLRERFRKD